MKRFDESAARKGARVCTRGGGNTIILRFDLNRDDNKNILAVFCMRGRFDEQKTRIGVFPSNGQFCDDMEGLNDLMMADDNYLKKLERGEYGNATIEAPVWQEPHRIMTPEDTAKVTFLSPFDESYWRKQYAGMAMQGLCAANGTMKPASMVADVAVEYADALVEKLKKEKE